MNDLMTDSLAFLLTLLHRGNTMTNKQRILLHHLETVSQLAYENHKSEILCAEVFDVIDTNRSVENV